MLYRNGYTAMVLSATFIFSVSCSVYSIVPHRRIHSPQVQSVQKKWSNRSDCRHVVITTVDDFELKGVVFERENAQRIILGCHGYKKSKESWYGLPDLFPDDIVILFDFRAQGESDGRFISYGYHERKDIAAVVSFIRQNYDKQLPLFGLGFSMGAASLIGAAADGVVFDGLVLNSSFSFLPDQMSHVFRAETGLPNVPFLSAITVFCPLVLGFTLSDIAPAEWIKSVLCPVSIVHAVDDSYVLVESAHMLCANAPNLSNCWFIENGGHRRALSVCPEEYQSYCESFFSSCRTPAKHSKSCL